MKAILDLTVAAVPLKMYGEEDDVKGLAVFLASKASNYITGGIFPVDGGFSAQ
jgi:NAD(P)-dependent dehydrogenase (short-subunit alcohol dehydrogenase family)